MFTAYFDASGDSSCVALTVAGCVSDVKKWKRFEGCWNYILQREGVSVFHMTDFASSRGEFKGWEGQTERRRAFLSDLLECGRRNVNKAFAIVVMMSDYEMVNKHFQLQESCGLPYVLGGHQCVKMVRTWQSRNKKVRELEVAFESGDLHQGKLRQLCLTEGIDPDFLGKKELKATPFQLGDLIAWRTRVAFTETRRPDLTFERGEQLKATFGDIWKRFPHGAIYADQGWLERMCIRLRIPRRK